MDLFCGAGGMSLGLKRAGFQVALALDNDIHVEKTYARNNKHTTYLSLDLSETSAHDVLRKGGLDHGDIDLVVGCPPCKGFSSANHNRRNANDPRNKLVDDFFGLVLDIKPRAFFMENVMGMLWYNGGYLRRSHCIPQLPQYGYDVCVVSFDAADYGVPQRRQRLFIIGTPAGLDFRLPKPVWGSRDRPYVSVGDAIIGDLPIVGTERGWDLCDYVRPPQTAYQKMIRSRAKKVHNHITTVNCDKVRRRIAKVPLGGSWRDLPKRYLDIKVRYSSVYKRLNADQPSVTLGNFRKNMLIHPYEDRLLTLREAARLQGFPDTYIFDGPISHMQQQIADATPPPLAFAVGKALARHLMRYTDEEDESKKGASLSGRIIEMV